MDTKWLIETPEFKIGYTIEHGHPFMHFDLCCSELKLSTARRIKAAWARVLECMRRVGVKRIYSHHGNHLPKITTKLAQLGGMSMFHRHPEGVFYYKDLDHG